MFRKNKQENIPFEFDWGQVTPEKYNDSTKEAFYVCNFCMTNDESRNIAGLFLSGKILWYSNHLPVGTSHRIRMDIRGQYVSFGILSAWKSNLIQNVVDQNKEIIIKIEFHTD